MPCYKTLAEFVKPTLRGTWFGVEEREGDEGFVGVAGCGEKFGFQFTRDGHCAGGDFVFCGAGEAEVTASQRLVVGDARGRAEDAAGHGAVGVDIAEAGDGIEGGTGRFIGEGFKAGLLFVGGAEDAGGAVAGKVGGVGGEPGLGAVFEGCRGLGIRGLQEAHPRLETGDIEGVDRESTVAALGAAGTAGEPGAGAVCSVGEGSVDDLDELAVARGQRHGERIREGPGSVNSEEWAVNSDQ